MPNWNLIALHNQLKNIFYIIFTYGKKQQWSKWESRLDFTFFLLYIACRSHTSKPPSTLSVKVSIAVFLHILPGASHVFFTQSCLSAHTVQIYLLFIKQEPRRHIWKVDSTVGQKLDGFLLLCLWKVLMHTEHTLWSFNFWHNFNFLWLKLSIILECYIIFLYYNWYICSKNICVFFSSLWRHPWAVLWLDEAFWSRRVSSQHTVSLPGWLCGQRVFQYWSKLQQCTSHIQCLFFICYKTLNKNVLIF